MTPQAVMGLQGASASGPARTFAAVLQLFCPAALLPGLLRCLCRLLLPFWAFTAFVDFYWISRLLLTLSTFTAFVDFYCLYLLLLPMSAFTAFVWCCSRCLLCWLWLLNVVTCWSDQLFCFDTWLADSNKLLSLYRDRSPLVYIYIYIYYIYIYT